MCDPGFTYIDILKQSIKNPAHLKYAIEQFNLIFQKSFNLYKTELVHFKSKFGEGTEHFIKTNQWGDYVQTFNVLTHQDFVKKLGGVWAYEVSETNLLGESKSQKVHTHLLTCEEPLFYRQIDSNQNLQNKIFQACKTNDVKELKRLETIVRNMDKFTDGTSPVVIYTNQGPYPSDYIVELSKKNDTEFCLEKYQKSKHIDTLDIMGEC